MNYLSVFFRILLNHLQILTLTASFDLSWPENLLKFFKDIQPFSDVQNQLFSIDCIITNQSAARFYAIKTFLLSVIPVAIILVFTFGIWLYYNKIKKRQQQVDINMSAIEDFQETGQTPKAQGAHSNQVNFAMAQREAASDQFFLLHPTITRDMFSLLKQCFNSLILFSCKQIEGVPRLYTDLETVCYQDIHLKVVLWIGIPSIIVYSLGIPTLGLALLYRHRQSLEKSHITQQYGFLYKGYRAGFSSYWEMVVIYRKVILIFIQVFLIQKGKITQALITLVFLSICILLVKYFQPYSKPYMNRLEILSLLTQAVSVYFGIYYISNSMTKSIQAQIDSKELLSEDSSLLIFVTIVFVNMAYFAYWLASFMKEFSTTMRVKYPRLYTAVCLCCKQWKFMLKREVDEHHKRVKPVIDDMNELIEFFEQRKEMLQKGLVTPDDKDLKEKIMMLMKFKKQIDSNSKLVTNQAYSIKVEELLTFKHLSNAEVTSKRSLTISPYLLDWPPEKPPECEDVYEMEKKLSERLSVIKKKRNRPIKMSSLISQRQKDFGRSKLQLLELDLSKADKQREEEEYAVPESPSDDQFIQIKSDNQALSNHFEKIEETNNISGQIFKDSTDQPNPTVSYPREKSKFIISSAKLTSHTFQRGIQSFNMDKKLNSFLPPIIPNTINGSRIQELFLEQNASNYEQPKQGIEDFDSVQVEKEGVKRKSLITKALSLQIYPDTQNERNTHLPDERVGTGLAPQDIGPNSQNFEEDESMSISQALQGGKIIVRPRQPNKKLEEKRKKRNTLTMKSTRSLVGSDRF
ncbi:hypothetical protein FGO68_gene5028 [Halteria grandinella]|uniref:Uncharacterized protein n=1 Tax=Halteria grandinella TaxID=5974 RepID=A0A8J8P903_HALGN|nr:hypothetical protein FGO68_gene5028 [Halteria grandinella]